MGANILDALVNEHYFTSIIDKYRQEGEQILIYMDVNGTIMNKDSIMNIQPHQMLLDKLYDLVEARPNASSSFDFQWEDLPQLNVDKPTSIKRILKAITQDDEERMKSFWNRESAKQLLEKVHGSV